MSRRPPPLNPGLTELVCIVCDERHAAIPEATTCPGCGDDGVLDARFDLDRAANAWSRGASDRMRDAWRFAELLPVTPPAPERRRRVGGTPMFRSPVLERRYGLRRVWIKDETVNPTGSLKDRASMIAVRLATSRGATCSSTGNAATSLAGLAASEEIPAVIFVPATCPAPKVAQLRAYGALVVRVGGGYEAAYRLSREFASAYGLLDRNAAVNPFLVEGKKTCGLEIAEACGTTPADTVIVPVGDGCTIAGIGKGLEEGRRLGLCQGSPRLLGVQAQTVAPIATAAASDGIVRPAVGGRSAAESIAVPSPRNWRKALLAVAASGGDWLVVDDDAILGAVRELGAAGIFAEPAAAAALAGLRAGKDSGKLRHGERVVLVVTGSGLKDPSAAEQRFSPPLDVTGERDSLASVATAFRRRFTASPGSENHE